MIASARTRRTALAWLGIVILSWVSGHADAEATTDHRFSVRNETRKLLNCQFSENQVRWEPVQKLGRGEVAVRDAESEQLYLYCQKPIDRTVYILSPGHSYRFRKDFETGKILFEESTSTNTAPPR